MLDSQIQSKGPNLTTNRFSAEADKSYIFLLYPPNHENNHNPDNLLTRVPFRNLVVGLLSHQLLLQTMGCVLLQTPSIPEAEDSCNSSAPNTDNQEDIPSRLPGMLPYLSTRNIAKILDCLYVSYQIACDFDSRPGLKFLIQKVAQTSVAANLYKQAGASMVFYIHTLIEISSNINTLKLEGIRQSLKQVSTSSMNDQQTCIQHASTMMSSITDNMDIFLFLLQNICDELCQTYVDMTLDEETTTCVDRLSEQPLVFLIAQADDLCDITGSNGTESKQLSSTSSQENNNIYPTSAPVNLQSVEGQVVQTDDVAPTDDNESVAGTITNPKEDYSINPSDLKSKKEKRAEKESRVYTVATDKLIKNLMTEYKKRKQQHSMPTFVKAGKVPNNKANTAQVFKQREPVDYEIEKQQKVSIMKDSEAHLKSWTELLCAILRLFQELPDSKFYALLPTVFNCINQLVCHSHEQRLNDALAQWLHRVGHMVGINPL